MTADWPFGDLPRGEARVVLADPPWKFITRGMARCTGKNGGGDRAAPYVTMATDDICALPVADLASDDCVLFVWACWPHILDALRVIDSWGFTYKTCAFAWMKADVSTIDLFPDPKTADMKLGYWTRANSEPCLLATRGNPKRVDAGVRQGIIERAREHSRKPDCQYERIERLCGDVPRVELFARTTRHGWSSWGNQVGKFREVA